MALAVSHSTVVTVPDDPRYPVGSDEWNANHTLTGTLAPTQIDLTATYAWTGPHSFTNLIDATGGGQLIANTNAIDGVRMLPSTGNFAGGTYVVKGVSYS